MEALQDTKIETNSTNPAIVTNQATDVSVQLEGTHTTSTETEEENLRERKNVKFQDEQQMEKRSKITACEEAGRMEMALNTVIKTSILDKEGKKEERSEAETPQARIKIYEKPMSHDNKPPGQSSDLSAVVNSPFTTSNDPKMKLQYKDAETLEISQRFNQILDMFDSFTKNLETLDLTTKLRKKSFCQREIEKPQTYRSRFREDQREEDCQDSQQNKGKLTSRGISSSVGDIELLCRQHFGGSENQQEIIFQDSKDSNKKVSVSTETACHKARSVSTATSSCKLKSLGCQTLPADQVSLNDISLMEISSVTSRSGPPNSLNNYAEADNACVSHYPNQQDITKKPLITSTEQESSMNPAITQQPTTPAFNIITIEANATPSSSDLRRRPLCHRLWTVICDFCAATCLCLQVNRDCILSLVFCAAFVVSASFLTAFFYHTLSVSPSLWQNTDTVRL